MRAQQNDKLWERYGTRNSVAGEPEADESNPPATRVVRIPIGGTMPSYLLLMRAVR